MGEVSSLQLPLRSSVQVGQREHEIDKLSWRRGDCMGTSGVLWEGEYYKWAGAWTPESE